MNGVMNLSVLDGWWVEGYREDAGWALSMDRSYEHQDFQDELDSETIYALIENEIAPKFYKRNANNVPTEWVQMIKNTIAKVASNFTTNRMLQDYEDRYYNKLHARSKDICADDFAKVKEIAEWKRRVSRHWESIEVIFRKRLNMQEEEVMLGNLYQSEVQLDIALLDPEDVGVEMVVAEQEPNGSMKIISTSEYTCVSHVGSVATYTIDVLPGKPGVIFAGVRLYAKHPYLPHRQDFALVRWI
jgi:phosphorylase/glycogen(starch) synthase